MDVLECIVKFVGKGVDIVCNFFFVSFNVRLSEKINICWIEGGLCWCGIRVRNFLRY